MFAYWAIKASYSNRDGGHFHGWLMPPNHAPISWQHQALFDTRAEARVAQQKHYGYLHHRPDLRRAPHFWRSPRVVRVRVTIEEIG